MLMRGSARGIPIGFFDGFISQHGLGRGAQITSEQGMTVYFQGQTNQTCNSLGLAGSDSPHLRSAPRPH